MKPLTVILILFCFCSYHFSFSQNRIDEYEVMSGQFCYIDSVGERTVYNTNCLVTEDKTYRYFKFLSEYGFTIKNENKKQLYSVIANYEQQKPKSGQIITLGSYKCYSIQGRSTKEKVLHPGQYETTYVNDASITIQYNGHYLLLNFPKTTFIGFTSPPHTIYVPQRCIELILDALK